MGKTAYIDIFGTFYSHFIERDRNKTNHSVLEVGFSRDSLSKVLRKYLKKKNLQFKPSVCEKALMYLHKFPQFKDMINQSPELQDFLEEMQFKVVNFIDYTNPLSLQEFLSLSDEESNNYGSSSKRYTNSSIFFDIITDMEDEEVYSFRSEMERLIRPTVEDWFDENWDKLSDWLEKLQAEVDERNSDRKARKSNVKEVGVHGYLATDSWNKPLAFGIKRSDISVPYDRIYLILNDGSIQRPKS